MVDYQYKTRLHNLLALVRLTRSHFKQLMPIRFIDSMEDPENYLICKLQKNEEEYRD